MNFSMRGHDFDVHTIRELSDKCSEYGLYGLQLAIAKSITDFKKGSFCPAYAEKIKAELGSAKIPVLGCYINPSCTDTESLREQLDTFKEQLLYAKFTGAHLVGLETGYVGENCIPEDNHTEYAYQYLLKSMRELAACAEKLGVMIGVEGVACFVINTPQKMRRLLDDINSPNVLVIFDPVNYLSGDNYTNQDKMIDDAIELLGDKIAVLHLKDFTVQDGIIRQVLPTEGILNTRKILEFVKTRKPDLPIVLENVKEHDLKKVIKNVEMLYSEI